MEKFIIRWALKRIALRCYSKTYYSLEKYGIEDMIIPVDIGTRFFLAKDEMAIIIRKP